MSDLEGRDIQMIWIMSDLPATVQAPSILGRLHQGCHTRHKNPNWSAVTGLEVRLHAAPTGAYGTIDQATSQAVPATIVADPDCGGLHVEIHRSDPKQTLRLRS